MKNNTSIGIDNGVTGGIVAIDDNGQIITKFKMPIVKRKWGLLHQERGSESR